MEYPKHNFNQSMKYTYTIRDSVKDYVQEMRTLYVSLFKRKYEYTKYFDRFLTAFKSTTFLKNQQDAVKDGKDYRVYNLTRAAKAKNVENKINKTFSVVNSLQFNFKNAACMKDFIKDFGFKKDEIVYSCWTDKNKLYSFTIKFDKGVHINQAKLFIRKCKTIFDNSRRYGSWGVDTCILLPSSIHDRWFDAFKQKTIWDVKPVFEKAKSAKALDLCTLYKRFEPYLSQYNSYNIRNSSRCSNYIANGKNIRIENKRCNTYIVNHFLDFYNPYKRNCNRKDWKFAVESYLNEFLGRINYNNKYGIEDIKISKAEIILFLRSLDIKTKIDANKFKRNIAKILLDFNFVETNFYYKPKIKCRSYKVCLDNLVKFYKKLLERIKNNFKFNFNFIYMLKNHNIVEFIEKEILSYNEPLLLTYEGSPPKT